MATTTVVPPNRFFSTGFFLLRGISLLASVVVVVVAVLLLLRGGGRGDERNTHTAPAKVGAAREIAPVNAADAAAAVCCVLLCICSPLLSVRFLRACGRGGGGRPRAA